MEFKLKKNKAYERQKESRAFRGSVGLADAYDAIGAYQFSILTHFGLREHHRLLDIGCGSLRGGRLFIPYLGEGNYFGIEPNERVVKLGLLIELGQEMVEMRQPSFLTDDNFSLTDFERQFDYLLAYSIFTHTSQSQMRRCFSEASRVMHENSVFLATYGKTETDYEEDVWFPSPEHKARMKEDPVGMRKKFPGFPGIGYRTETLIGLAKEFGLHGEEIPYEKTCLFGPPSEDKFPKQWWLKITKPS